MGDGEAGTGAEPGGTAAEPAQSGPPLEPEEHELVAAARRTLAPIPSTVTLTGLFGKSEDAEKRRVYFSPQLNRYAEFSASDVVRYDPVPAAQSPVPGYDATRVTLKRGSPIELTQTSNESVTADDQFDLDFRVGTAGPLSPVLRSGTTTLVCRTMTVEHGCFDLPFGKGGGGILDAGRP
jgi:hypothetical protein